MQSGLTTAEASAKLAKDGPNALPVSAPQTHWRLLLAVLSEPMFLLLVACGGLYALLGDKQEALMLLGFVAMVIAISYVQQRRTAHSLAALRDLSSPRALVIRDGVQRRIAGNALVCGDIVLLAEGDRVPADMQLVEANNLAVNESMLSGESAPVSKQAEPLKNEVSEIEPNIDSARVFAGTLVTQGTATCSVIATGARSALGTIGASLQQIGADTTPIQKETRRVVNVVAVVGLVLAAGLALAYWLQRGDALRSLLAGLTFAMAILPEELPVVLTLFMGLGAWRLAREKVLARSIPAIELLGAATVLCVDKTGTLTTNQMAMRHLWCDDGQYDTVSAEDAPLPEALHPTLEYAVLASHRRAFDPMETAITDAGKRLLADTEHLHADWTLVEDYPLSNEMLALSRVWQSPEQQQYLIAAKGAPEAIVDLCHLDAARAATIAAQVLVMAGNGLRVLGVARAEFGAAALPANQHDFPFEFLGLVGLADPVRAEVPKAIAESHAAGIRVVVMTGDHPATAMSVGRQIGLASDAKVLTGMELDALSDEALAQQLPSTAIFCRVKPEQKLRLVQAFRKLGEIVAMTGDGVNDAPALKAAQIGVAMGARGTDVAREAAALVLLDDDFSSIVTAIRFGRRVFANLRKAVSFIVAVHIPIIGLSILPVVFGWPMLLMPVHILFLQLVIDPACSVVFEAEPLESDAMRKPPRQTKARLFDKLLLVRGIAQGMGLLLLLLATYAGVVRYSGSHDMARAMTFTVLILSNLALIYANRSWRQPCWQRPAGANPAFLWVAGATLVLLACVLGIPALSRLFTFVQPTPSLLPLALLAGIASLGWFELVKWLVARWLPEDATAVAT